MKRQVRCGVFETNSSSSHAVSVSRRSEPYYDTYELTESIDSDGVLHSEFGEFGWGIDSYTDAETKLQYALTMVVETECSDAKSIDDFYATEGFNALKNAVCERLNCTDLVVDSKCEYNSDYDYLSRDGYIDHQSCEDYRSLQDFLNDYDVTLDDFIFNDNVKLIIDHDNH